MAKKSAKKSTQAPKTVLTGDSVPDFLAAIEDDERRKDCQALAKLLKRVTGAAPRMWGPSIVGFGERHYRYESGREGDWFQAGFAPRKQDLTLYLAADFPGRAELLRKLGKHKTGKACVYMKRLSDVDLEVLEELVRRSAAG